MTARTPQPRPRWSRWVATGSRIAVAPSPAHQAVAIDTGDPVADRRRGRGRGGSRGRRPSGARPSSVKVEFSKPARCTATRSATASAASTTAAPSSETVGDQRSRSACSATHGSGSSVQPSPARMRRVAVSARRSAYTSSPAQLAAGLGDVLAEARRRARDRAAPRSGRRTPSSRPTASRASPSHQPTNAPSMAVVVETQVPAQVALVEAGGHPLGVGPRRHRGEQLTDRGAVVGTAGDHPPLPRGQGRRHDLGDVVVLEGEALAQEGLGTEVGASW